jgi:hypothetical protein
MFGWAVTVLAAVWVLLTGGCTLVFLAMAVGPLFNASMVNDGLGLIPIVLVVGAIGIAPSAALFWVGSKLRRPPRTG